LVVIPNGRDPGRFQPRATHDAQADAVPEVLFLGRMIPGKRPELFVRLVGELRSRGVKLRAIAVGDGPLLRVLEPEAARAGVELAGPSGDVGGVLQQADLLVFPSAPEGEGMPGVLIEAGLSGLPVVATGVAGVASVVANGETGLVVGVEDFEALVGATSELLGDPERRLAMGSAARERCVERFSLEASARGWQELLDRLTAAN
jgi:glycosyltransferase involved in cell wall biosynthesis